MPNDSTRLPIHEFAKKMRYEPTFCETSLHTAMLNVFMGFDTQIHPQFVVGPYVADFLINGVIIEVDGKSHDKQMEYDARRTTYLRNRGFRVIRYRNSAVMENARGVAERIFEETRPHTQIVSEKQVRVTKCPPGSAIHGKPGYGRKGLRQTYI